MKINEIFSSIQGEGQYTGTPSIFIRFHGCPVKCKWCDTPWTWEADLNNKVPLQYLLKVPGQKLWAEATVDEVIETVQVQLTNTKVTHAVITGGEPLMHLSDVSTLLSSLYNNTGIQSAQMETSGAILLEKRWLDWLRATTNYRTNGLHITCSPKRAAIQSEFEAIVQEWKIPIEEPVQEGALIYAGKLARRNVYLQPVHYKADKKRSEMAVCNAVTLCKTYGFKLSLQTHKFIGVR